MLPLIRKKDFIGYLAGTIFLTIFFHVSSLILLPVYLFCNWGLGIRNKVLCCGLFFLGILFAEKLISMTVYSIYLSKTAFIRTVPLTSYVIFILSFIFSFIPFCSRRINDSILENLNFICLLVSCAILVFSNSPLEILIIRISYFFVPVYIVLLPRFVANIVDLRLRNFIRFSLEVVFILIFVMSVVINGKTNRIVPYKSYLVESIRGNEWL